MNRSMLSAFTRPEEVPERVYVRRRLERGPRVVAFGGGTGLSRALSGLKEGTANLTAVVAVTDDGGSTGRLRLAYGLPAVGDLVDCLAALSDHPALPRLLAYRFHRGSFPATPSATSSSSPCTRRAGTSPRRCARPTPS